MSRSLKVKDKNIVNVSINRHENGLIGLPTCYDASDIMQFSPVTRETGFIAAPTRQHNKFDHGLVPLGAKSRTAPAAATVWVTASPPNRICKHHSLPVGEIPPVNSPQLAFPGIIPQSLIDLSPWAADTCN